MHHSQRLSGPVSNHTLETEREHMLDRPQSIRGVLVAEDQDAARSRRHAARLRLQNSALLEEVRRLQRNAAAARTGLLESAGPDRPTRRRRPR